jgi:hypothetical protein
MATFKIMKGTAKGKTWKAVGTNPVSGRQMTIQGGQGGTRVGKNNPDSERTFDARHEATGMTPKKYINKLRWDNKAKFGSSVNIPDELFTAAGKKKAAAKRASAIGKKSAVRGASGTGKKAAKKKTVTKKKTAVNKKDASNRKTGTYKKGAVNKKGTANKKTAG